MNCRSARKIIPDFTRGVLSDGKKKGLERHLRNCQACRADSAAFRTGIEAMKTPGAIEDMDFTEAEWTAAIQAAVTSHGEKKSGRFVPAFRPAFGYTLGVLLVGAAVLFGVRRFPWLVPTMENRPSAAAAAMARQPDIIEPINPEIAFSDSNLWARADRAVPLSSLPSPAPLPAGDVPSFTWISQETGLQIVWFVNDNLKMED
ncbi:MAG: zf-HC2 domain-containing protein [Candidatus Aminicenantes bacterium]|nr:zf-HC2 domain-containing protein [Candidatus Aminicenantes bacterium]